MIKKDNNSLKKVKRKNDLKKYRNKSIYWIIQNSKIVKKLNNTSIAKKLHLSAGYIFFLKLWIKIKSFSSISTEKVSNLLSIKFAGFSFKTIAFLVSVGGLIIGASRFMIVLDEKNKEIVISSTKPVQDFDISNKIEWNYTANKSHLDWYLEGNMVSPFSLIPSVDGASAKLKSKNYSGAVDEGNYILKINAIDRRTGYGKVYIETFEIKNETDFVYRVDKKEWYASQETAEAIKINYVLNKKPLGNWGVRLSGLDSKKFSWTILTALNTVEIKPVTDLSINDYFVDVEIFDSFMPTRQIHDSLLISVRWDELYTVVNNSGDIKTRIIKLECFSPKNEGLNFSCDLDKKEPPNTGTWELRDSTGVLVSEPYNPFKTVELAADKINLSVNGKKLPADTDLYLVTKFEYTGELKPRSITSTWKIEISPEAVLSQSFQNKTTLIKNVEGTDKIIIDCSLQIREASNFNLSLTGNDSARFDATTFSLAQQLYFSIDTKDHVPLKPGKYNINISIENSIDYTPYIRKIIFPSEYVYISTSFNKFIIDESENNSFLGLNDKRNPSDEDHNMVIPLEYTPSDSNKSQKINSIGYSKEKDDKELVQMDSFSNYKKIIFVGNDVPTENPCYINAVLSSSIEKSTITNFELIGNYEFSERASFGTNLNIENFVFNSENSWKWIGTSNQYEDRFFSTTKKFVLLKNWITVVTGKNNQLSFQNWSVPERLDFLGFSIYDLQFLFNFVEKI